MTLFLRKENVGRTANVLLSMNVLCKLSQRCQFNYIYI